jgi:DNA recombination protein RmuC
MIWDANPFFVYGAMGFGGFLLATLVFTLWRNGLIRAIEIEDRRVHARVLESEFAALKGRVEALAGLSMNGQGELGRALHERLDRVSMNVGWNLEETQRKTTESLAKLQERMAVIDSAQKSLNELSSRMVSLQDILANKQARGAFGQIRMECIIEDSLPHGSFSFQPTLSNGKRPDCLIHLPNSSAGIVVDAKFPLEAFEALRVAHQESMVRSAMRRVKFDVSRHVDDIAEKYFLPGETQDTALMFVPSEAIYAELHERFADLIQRAHRARVVIVSPNMLMLAVQTMQSIMKDVRMREQAGVIQGEVSKLLDEVRRLHERALDFQRHFGLLGQDVEKLLASTGKISKRGRRIEALDFEDDAPTPASPVPPTTTTNNHATTGIGEAAFVATLNGATLNGET